MSVADARRLGLEVPKAKQKASPLKAQPDYPAALMFHLHAAKLPAPVREHVFDQCGRQWRFDLCWPEQRIGVEIDGGVWSGGRHTRGAGFIEDCIKLNSAVLQGWRVLRFVPDHITSGYASQVLREALEGR